MARLSWFLLVVVLSAGSVLAQPTVDVYWDINVPADTVIDFGVTKEGFPVTRTISVRNRSASTVALLEAVSGADDPYFVIYNDTANGVPANARFKEEFRPLDLFPRYVRPGEIGTIRVQFRALAGDPGLPPDTVNRSMLDIRVADSASPLGPTRFARFVLLALKTTRILASTTPTIQFDSVYVGPSPAAPVKEYTLANIIDQTIPVEAQRVTMLSPVTTLPEITATTFTQVTFPPKGAVTWSLRYDPVDRGEDSAYFVVAYRPEPTAKLDSVLAKVKGVGVEQRLRVVTASGDPAPVRLRGDTIDFGDVFADNVGSAARIVVTNEGNCSIGIVQESRLGTQRDTTAFRVEQPLIDGGASIEVGRSDTMLIRFVPVDSGPHFMRYVVRTNLRERGILGVPDGAQDISFIVKGRGLRPQLQLTPPSLDYGTVVRLETCESEVQRTLRIANVGNTDLRIDSITATLTSGEVIYDRRVISIAPAANESVTVSFRPEGRGPQTGTLYLHTNGLREPISVPITADVVDPDTISVALPEMRRARPGRVIGIPVVVDAATVTSASRCVIRTSYDPSLLRFRSLAKIGTASEGATEHQAAETVAGVLTVDLEMPGNFLRRDTVVILTFDTFLGKRASTELAVTADGVTFGSTACPSALIVRPSSGRFELDSVCGLDYKTASGMGMIASVYPNPATTTATVAIMLREPQHVAMRLVDNQGAEVFRKEVSAMPAGSNLLPFPLEQIDIGAYTVDIIAGRRRVVIPFVRLP